jgi:hypothetical protein
MENVTFVLYKKAKSHSGLCSPMFTYRHYLLMTLPSAPQLSGQVQVDAGFLYDKTVMLNAAIQEPPERRK